MRKTIFGFIWQFSKRQQFNILTLTVISFPFLYLSLELPKIIINDALGGAGGGREYYGVYLTQVEYLLTLCFIFLALVLINGGFKYVINVYKGIVGERMLRRLRYELYSRIIRFPLPHFRKVSSNETAQMITAEVEPLGGFVGDAFALPAYQGGTLLTILAFVFVQDPIMGVAAIILYPLQIYIIPRLQREVNNLGKQRVRQVRRLSTQIGETYYGVPTIRANDAALYERSRFSRELGVIYRIRMQIYRKKFFIKFINNFIAQIGPFFFYSIGGYLVLQGNLTLGALVAVISAQKELYSPWKELLTYYQTMYDAVIKYEQVINQFDLPNMVDPAMQEADDVERKTISGPMKANHITLLQDDSKVLEDVSFQIDLPSHIAVLGSAGCGREELLMIAANLLPPDQGRLLINDDDVHRWPEAITGRQFAYVDNPAHVFGGTLLDNLLYGLRHRPVQPPPADIERIGGTVDEAVMAGNSPLDPEADWTDYTVAGITQDDALLPRLIEVLRLVRLEGDVYRMGLRGTLPLQNEADQGRILEARRRMRERLADDSRLSRLVEVFDINSYNHQSSVAENLLFGTPLDDSYQVENLPNNPYMLQILNQAGLEADLRRVGYEMAETMVELFADLPPDHDYFRQYSFISPEDLPDYRAIVSHADVDTLDSLNERDRERLLALPFMLIVGQHRLGLVEADLQQRILDARRLFREELPASERDKIAFFNADDFNPAASIQDNILFGKIVQSQANAEERISALVEEVIGELELGDLIIDIGLRSEAGVGGTRLSMAQRQKLALGRALLKQPDLVLMVDALGPLDVPEQAAVTDALLEILQGRTIIWSLSRGEWAEKFDQVLVLRNGRLSAQGSYAELQADGQALKGLLSS